MINFLHTYNPSPILISFGPINIYWYGFFITAGILTAILVVFKLIELYQIEKASIIDIIFYLIIGGLAGARLFHVIIEWPFYFKNPLNIFKIWQGGLAIHGAIIAGLIITWFLAKKYSANFWQLAALFAPAVSLAQAIGRWGNYFNQELFGRPTNLPWSIPIDPLNRWPLYYDYQYFHPTFLYESIGNFLIFLILISMHFSILKNKQKDKLPWFCSFAPTLKNNCFLLCLLFYLIAYSLLRFLIEFLRIDPVPEILGLRLPQITSLLIISASFSSFFWLHYKNIANIVKTN